MALYEELACASRPVDDRRKYPILTRHWGDLHPAEVVADLRFRQQVERLHALGPRVTAELLAEIGIERSIMPVINAKLRTYADIDPEALRAVGGDKFWPSPVREVLS